MLEEDHPGQMPVASFQKNQILLGDALQRFAHHLHASLHEVLQSLQEQDDPELRTTELREFLSKSKRKTSQMLALIGHILKPHVKIMFSSLTTFYKKNEELFLLMSQDLDEFFFLHSFLYGQKTKKYEVYMALKILSASLRGSLVSSFSSFSSSAASSLLPSSIFTSARIKFPILSSKLFNYIQENKDSLLEFKNFNSLSVIERESRQKIMKNLDFYLRLHLRLKYDVKKISQRFGIRLRIKDGLLHILNFNFYYAVFSLNEFSLEASWKIIHFQYLPDPLLKKKNEEKRNENDENSFDFSLLTSSYDTLSRQKVDEIFSSITFQSLPFDFEFVHQLLQSSSPFLDLITLLSLIEHGTMVIRLKSFYEKMSKLIYNPIYQRNFDVKLEVINKNDPGSDSIDSIKDTMTKDSSEDSFHLFFFCWKNLKSNIYQYCFEFSLPCLSDFIEENKRVLSHDNNEIITLAGLSTNFYYFNENNTDSDPKANKLEKKYSVLSVFPLVSLKSIIDFSYDGILVINTLSNYLINFLLLYIKHRIIFTLNFYFKVNYYRVKIKNNTIIIQNYSDSMKILLRINNNNGEISHEVINNNNDNIINYFNNEFLRFNDELNNLDSQLHFHSFFSSFMLNIPYDISSTDQFCFRNNQNYFNFFQFKPYVTLISILKVIELSSWSFFLNNYLVINDKEENIIIKQAFIDYMKEEKQKQSHGTKNIIDSYDSFSFLFLSYRLCFWEKEDHYKKQFKSSMTSLNKYSKNTSNNKFTEKINKSNYILFPPGVLDNSPQKTPTSISALVLPTIESKSYYVNYIIVHTNNQYDFFVSSILCEVEISTTNFFPIKHKIQKISTNSLNLTERLKENYLKISDININNDSYDENEQKIIKLNQEIGSILLNFLIDSQLNLRNSMNCSLIPCPQFTINIKINFPHIFSIEKFIDEVTFMYIENNNKKKNSILVQFYTTKALQFMIPIIQSDDPTSNSSIIVKNNQEVFDNYKVKNKIEDKLIKFATIEFDLLVPVNTQSVLSTACQFFLKSLRFNYFGSSDSLVTLYQSVLPIYSLVSSHIYIQLHLQITDLFLIIQYYRSLLVLFWILILTHKDEFKNNYLFEMIKEKDSDNKDVKIINNRKKIIFHYKLIKKVGKENIIVNYFIIEFPLPYYDEKNDNYEFDLVHFRYSNSETFYTISINDINFSNSQKIINTLIEKLV